MILLKAVIYSGRPNPEKTLNETESLELIKDVLDNRALIERRESIIPILGKKFLNVSFLADGLAKKYNLPRDFVIETGSGLFDKWMNKFIGR